MKTLLTLAGLALICASGASAGFAKQWTVPWWTDANPHTDSDGNTWAVYQINAATDAVTADWKAMTWQSGAWRGPQQVYNQPYYGSDQALTVAGEDGGAYRNSGLSFTAGTAGVYSWTGSLYFTWDEQGRNITVDFGKFTGTTFTSLYSTTMSPETTLNLDTADNRLHNISLAAGETLGFSLIQPGSWYWGHANVANVGIGLVPEPGLAALLGLGGLALGCRRRR